ncbi:PREDICTED: regulatory solute carrier protein family 1 member 1 [Chinchilla lanigera]|nr:PREDICTED: regulatory solute carrier protein family 1 member 1 [Chinchilla lanigera]
MSSSPTSDGFTHPAHCSGPSPGVGSPPSLARSASASVCPTKPSDPDSIEPQAVKALKASSEFQMNSKKKELLPLQDLSDHAFSADESPAMPLHNSSEEAVMRDNLEKSAERSTQGLKFYLHTRQEANLSVTTTKMHEPLMLVDKKGWHPENQSLHQLKGLQQHTEPGSKQHEVQQDAPQDQGQLCDPGDLQLPEERQQGQQKSVDLKAAMTGDGLQQNACLPGTEKSFPPPGCFGCSNAEMLMEIDVVEQSLVAVLDSAGRQIAAVENAGASGLPSENPLMEVETSKCSRASGSANNPISTQALQLPESNVEMSGTNNEHGENLPSLSLCGSCQPSVEAAEEPCSSVTAALKELHELLISSSKPASENTPEGSCQSETVPEGQTGVTESQTQNECLPHRDPCPQGCCHLATCVSVKTESVGGAPGARTEDAGSTGFQGPGDGPSADKEGAPTSRESVSGSGSVTVTSAKSSNQLPCTIGVEISPRLQAGEQDAVDQIPEQTQSSPSSFILVKDWGHGVQNPGIDRPETRENACPDAAWPFLELEPPTSHPLSSPSLLSPLIFPATDIDRILRAGFTLQEALGALHRVGGNADLALLVLLAKNIVVPT